MITVLGLRQPFPSVHLSGNLVPQQVKKLRQASFLSDTKLGLLLWVPPSQSPFPVHLSPNPKDCSALELLFAASNVLIDNS